MKNTILLITFLAYNACSNQAPRSDAYGNFEAVETTVSAEAQGKLLFFSVTEGAPLDSGVVVGCVDTMQLSLKRDQLKAAQLSIGARSSSILAEIDVLKERRAVIVTEKTRLENLFKEQAATQKQLDDVNGQLAIVEKQIVSIETQNASVLSEFRTIDAQIRQVDDQIRKSIVVNPVRGLVLQKTVQPYEIVNFGKPLYKIADVSHLELRVFVSGDQLPHIRLGQTVEVRFDETRTSDQASSGEITWIASQAEFTPKIIQTKEERVNLVYAVKVRVANDGRMKIGMPGEINFGGQNR